MSELELAIKIALEAHAGQRDKGGNPYILHPFRLMLKCDSPTMMMVAVLHDVVEDGNISFEDLVRLGMPIEVVDAVDCLTRRSGETYDDFIARVEKNPLAKKVKELDLLDNLDCSRLKNFSDSDAARMKRYTQALNRLRGTESLT